MKSRMNPNTELVYAPFRSLDDFILSQSRLADMTVPPENTKNLISRFQVPEYQNMDKFRNRVVSNLIYYQTNYAVLSLIFFTLVTYMNPLKMMLGILTITLFFCLLYYCDASQEQVKQMKREHPTLVMMATFLTAYFFIYQSGCVMVFITGVLLPVKATFLHAALRLRNIKNKIASVAEVAGVAKKTPMAVLLAEWGVEPDLKYIS